MKDVGFSLRIFPFLSSAEIITHVIMQIESLPLDPSDLVQSSAAAVVSEARVAPR